MSSTGGGGWLVDRTTGILPVLTGGTPVVPSDQQQNGEHQNQIRCKDRKAVIAGDEC